jgi:catechol 2,3-dioxygenase-like lactoylglutathione lyase family enzyme
MQITGADHTSYTISDLDRSLAFYTDVLGLEILWQRVIENPYFCEIIGFPACSVRGAHLRIPGSEHHIELFEYVQPSGSQADVRTMNVGSSHVSLVVDDLLAAYEELKGMGVEFRSPPVEITAGANAGGWGVYLLDPDGITVELFQRPRKRL